MARYIDADKLHEHITTNHCGECGIYNGEMCCSCPMDKALNYIEDFPIADVAPRAEVARKIFDEIHKIRSFGIYYNCAIINLDRLAEIEKKYTGESHD